MQVSKTMIEKYLYEEVVSIFKRNVANCSISGAKEDMDIVYSNLKTVTDEITEEVISCEVLDYLSNSCLWLKDDSTGYWEKTDLGDILVYIESNKNYVVNSMMEQLVDIINTISNEQSGVDGIDCEIL